jgi:hypothetical protein
MGVALTTCPEKYIIEAMERHVEIIRLRRVHAGPSMHHDRKEGLEALEMLRSGYIAWKYPDAEPRLQRTAVIVQRPKC